MPEIYTPRLGLVPDEVSEKIRSTSPYEGLKTLTKQVREIREVEVGPDIPLDDAFARVITRMAVGHHIIRRSRGVTLVSAEDRRQQVELLAQTFAEAELRGDEEGLNVAIFEAIAATDADQSRADIQRELSAASEIRDYATSRTG